MPLGHRFTEQRRKRPDHAGPHGVVLDQGGRQLKAPALGRLAPPAGVPLVPLLQDGDEQRLLGGRSPDDVAPAQAQAVTLAYASSANRACPSLLGWNQSQGLS